MEYCAGLTKGFTIPAKDEFPEKLFETIEGERNPKTGMIQPLFIFKVTDFIQRPCKNFMFRFNFKEILIHV